MSEHKLKTNPRREIWQQLKTINTNPVIRVWSPAAWQQEKKRLREQAAFWKGQR